MSSPPNSAATLLPCLNPSGFGLLTADKRKIKDFPKLPSATSFIRNTIAEIEAVLTPIVKRYLEKNEPMEVAKALTVVNKEIYRYEEEARRLRLTGELDVNIYKTVISGYRTCAIFRWK